MTLYMCRVAPRHEFEVQEAAIAEGIECMVARQVELKRIGKDAVPRIVERPYWPTYAFCELDEAQFYQWRDLRYVTQPTVPVGPLWARKVREALDAAEALRKRTLAELEAEERLTEFEEGDLVQIDEGPFAGLFGRFRNAVKYTQGPKLQIEVEAFGRAVKGEFQPIHVRRAAE